MTEDLARQASLQFAGGGSPETPNPEAVPDQQGGAGQQNNKQSATPQYVTLEQMQEILRQELTRFGQSITDRTADRVQKVMQRAQQKGVEIDPAQARAVLESLDEETQAQSQQRPGATNAQQNPAAPSDQRTPNQAQTPGVEGQPVEVHPVILAADAMMAKAQVYIDPQDPELQLIDQETTDELTFLTSVRAAITAKQQRLAQAGSPARMPQLGGAAKPGNPIANITNPDELWQLATNKGR